MSGYVIKVTMEDSHPPVWRRLIIPEKITFGDLHDILQIAFGWENDHMHDFSLPGETQRIGTDTSHGDLPEDRTSIDGYLQEYKWIRYTYDFGDDWRHKIVLEKTDETYEKRYATVIKYKGDNFEEDCGGVWVMYEDPGEIDEDDEMAWRYHRPEFSMEQVNLCLQRSSFPIARVTPVQNWKKDIKQIKQFMKEIRKHPENGSTFQQISDIFDSDVKKLLNVGTSAKEKERSIVGDMCTAWFSYVQKWEEEAERNRSRGEKKENVTYQQLSLFGEAEVWEEKTNSSQYSLEKGTSEKDWLRMLSNLNLSEITDYCKYLQIPVDAPISTKKERENYIKEIHNVLQAHPEYLLYVLDQKEWNALVDVWHHQDGVLEEIADTNCISKCFALGLIEYIQVDKNKRHMGYLNVVSNLDEIMEKVQALHIKNKYKEIRSFEITADRVLRIYGLLELSEFQNVYECVCGERKSKEKFLTLVYWHGKMTEFIQTCYTDDGTQYVAMYDIDVAAASRRMKLKANDVSIRELKYSEIHEILQGDYPAMEYWGMLSGMLCEKTDITQEECMEYIVKWESELRNGQTLDSMEEDIFMLAEKGDVSFWVDVYSAMLSVAMHTCIAGLKGYSRYALHEKYKKPLDFIPFFEETYLLENVDEITDVTNLAEMPSKVQSEIYAAAYAESDAVLIHRFGKLLSKIKVVNHEFEFLYVHCLLEHGQILRAQRELTKLRDSLDKEADRDLMREVDEWMNEIRYLQEEDPAAPFVRTEKKIGRNDPCPCGSGLKYKKCCGKN